MTAILKSQNQKMLRNKNFRGYLRERSGNYYINKIWTMCSTSNSNKQKKLHLPHWTESCLCSWLKPSFIN